MTEHVELKMGSRQTPGFFLSLQPVYTAVIFTLVLELGEMELV